MTISQLQSILESIDDKSLDIYSEFCIVTADQGPVYVTDAVFGARKEENALVFIGFPRSLDRPAAE